MKKLLLPLCLILVIAACTQGCLPTRGQLPAIDSFDASPPTISAGETSMLSWNVSGANTATIDQEVGNIALTGSRLVAPISTTTYTLTATNAAGSVTATAQIMVSRAPSTPVVLPTVNYFATEPSEITLGGSATLKWSVSNATSVTIDPGIGSFASSGTTTVSPAATTTYTLTATNAAGDTRAVAQVAVSGAPPPPPTFAVTNVTAGAAPSSFTGACPKSFNCSAVITANGPGTVTYVWERSDGGTSPTQTLTFAATGSQTVTTGWTCEASGSYWVRVRTLTPNEVVSDQASFTLTCEQPFAVTGVSVVADHTSYSGPCPKTFDLIATITANGPGTVTYRWERSDGGASPTQTVTFAAAGSEMVGTGWPREASGSYWVRVRILTPNEMVSDQLNLTLNCQPFTFTVTDVHVNSVPVAWTGSCPKTFELFANFTVNGPGTISYRWERSDGGASPTQTVTCDSEGATTMVRTGWPREASGSYWVRVRVLTPNEMVSNQANFTLTCE